MAHTAIGTTGQARLGGQGAAAAVLAASAAALGTALAFRQKGVKVKLPWFILGFIGAVLLNTYVPALHATGQVLVQLARLGLTATLFLIGAGLSAQAVRSVGARPFVLGALLWLAVSAVSLYVIRQANLTP